MPRIHNEGFISNKDFEGPSKVRGTTHLWGLKVHKCMAQECVSHQSIGLLAGAGPWELLVYSRVGVGLTGVLIVGLSVLAALGLCSLFGMWATLIILEVRPASLHSECYKLHQGLASAAACLDMPAPVKP